MIRGKDVIKKTLIIAISASILVSPIVFALSDHQMETNTDTFHKISVTVEGNNTKIISLPSFPTKIDTKHEIESSKFVEKPKNNLITNNKKGNYSTNIIYDNNYEYEVYKKGDEYDLRLFVPESYYEFGKKYTTREITFDIYYEEPKESFSSQKYEPQDDPIGDSDYLIITNESLEDVFTNNYRDWIVLNSPHIISARVFNITYINSLSSCWVNGTFGDAIADPINPWIPVGKNVTDHFTMFNDTQAHIRNFLRYCYEELNTRYVLLAGNKDVVPPRMATSRASGNSCSSFDNDLFHASDLYYSCLDYCMNNNTNSYWMENPCCGANWDEVDYGIDIQVGRVLVSNVTQAMNWINKTKAYFNGESNSYQNHIVACKDSGNSISNQSWTGWTGSEIGPNLEDEFPVNMSFVNNQNISQAQWSIMDDYVNGNVGSIEGINIIYHTGHGGTLNNDDGGCYNILNCENSNHPNFIYTEGCHSGKFGEGTNGRAENWMRDDDCMFAGVVNSAYGWFVASTYFGEEMMSIMFNNTRGLNNLTFCGAHNLARETQGSTTSDGVWAMIFKETNFLGDPVLDYKFYDASWESESSPDISIIDIQNKTNNSFIYISIPSFNWSIDNNASVYNLQIANDSGFTDLVVNLTDINVYNYPTYYSTNATEVNFILPSANQLEFYNKYYVRVKPLSKVER